MQSYFGIILHQMHVGVTGNTARNQVRDFGKYIVKSSGNNDFNDEVIDVVDDLSDAIQDAHVKNYTELSKELSNENDLIKEFGESYDAHMRAAKNGESVDKFIKSVKDIVKEIRTINDNNGLTGSLRYNEVSNSQLKELQSYMRDLSLTSKELFEKYGSEVR